MTICNDSTRGFITILNHYDACKFGPVNTCVLLEITRVMTQKLRAFLDNIQTVSVIYNRIKYNAEYA